MPYSNQAHCVCTRLSLIKCKTLSQYWNNTTSRSTDISITFWYLFFSLIPIWPCSCCLSSILFLPVLHAPLCFDYWLNVCVGGWGVRMCVYLEIEQNGHFWGKKDHRWALSNLCTSGFIPVQFSTQTSRLSRTFMYSVSHITSPQVYVCIHSIWSHIHFWKCSTN